MFTNNYIQLQQLLFCWRSETKMINCEGVQKSIYNYQAPHYYGNIGYAMVYARCAELPASYATSGHPYNTESPFGAYFGSGTTPATKEDYTLESIIDSGLSITNAYPVRITGPANGKYVVAADYIVRNISAEDITIGEIGIFAPISTINSDYTSIAKTTYGTFLMERTVLDEPIVIPAGEVKLVTYALHFNQTLSVD